MEKKIITVMGSQIGKEERATLHTATCECGNRIVRAKKESSLKFYIGNEKYKAKCCGSKLTYTGEKEFIGEDLVETKSNVLNQVAEQLGIEVKEIKVETVNQEDLKGELIINEKKEEGNKVVENTKETNTKEKNNKVSNIKDAKKTKRETDMAVAGDLIAVGRKGITNFQMIPAIKANANNVETLRKLYLIKPDIFKSSAVYTPDNTKVICLGIIREFEPTYKMPMGKKMAAELEAKEFENNNKAI